VKTINSPHWKGITFQVSLSLSVDERRILIAPLQIFDIPSRGDEPFEDRIEFLKKTFGPGGTHASDQIEVVGHELATSRQHVLDKLKEIEGLGGEGLMLRQPGSYAYSPLPYCTF
jgi:DNA ligase-1